MKPFILKDPEENIFAEGVELTNEKCIISFTKEKYVFVYDTLKEMMAVHSGKGENKLTYYKIVQE